MLVSGASCRLARVWDTPTDTIKHIVKGGRMMVGAVAWSPDGRLLAIVTKSYAVPNTVRLWEVATGTFTRVIPVPCVGNLHSVAWGPCGRFVFVAALSGTVHIFNVSEGQ